MRSVTVSAEVQGLPEQVWPLISSGPGLSSWFVATTVDGDGRGSRVVSDFGSGNESVAAVVDWEPPHRFTSRSDDLGSGAPIVETEWTVEPLSDGRCRVRVGHRLATESDAWDAHLLGWEEGWPEFFRLLHLRQRDFAGQDCAAFQVTRMVDVDAVEAWRWLAERLGLGPESIADSSPEQAPGRPVLSGRVEPARLATERVLRLKRPAPGLAHVFTMASDQGALAWLRIYLFGERPAEVVATEEPRWRRWME